ncbi:MAG TPA: amino acid ABC transporter permease, partial [Cyanothece sp. UBA12306]|nr:amino acid ABC transporter permease [Cyanothece sp. UBA12306]
MPQSISLPPISRVSPLTWVKKNLFSTWYNSILTVVSIFFLYWVASGLINWTFTQAQWGVIGANLQLFFVGRYPVDLLWRPWLSLAIIVSLGGLSWGILDKNLKLFNRFNLVVLGTLAVGIALMAIPISIKSSILLLVMLMLLVFAAWGGQQLGQKSLRLGNWLWPIWLLTFFVLLWLLEGGLFLKTVKLDDFSGLILTLLTAVVSIVLCFPFGILLALGRQSSLIIIRWLSIAYIELIRGLPLIGILFMAQVM